MPVIQEKQVRGMETEVQYKEEQKTQSTLIVLG